MWCSVRPLDVLTTKNCLDQVKAVEYIEILCSYVIGSVLLPYCYLCSLTPKSLDLLIGNPTANRYSNVAYRSCGMWWCVNWWCGVWWWCGRLWVVAFNDVALSTCCANMLWWCHYMIWQYGICQPSPWFAGISTRFRQFSTHTERWRDDVARFRELVHKKTKNNRK